MAAEKFSSDAHEPRKTSYAFPTEPMSTEAQGISLRSKNPIQPYLPKIERSHVPHLVHQLVGVVWVLLLGSSPVIIYKLDNTRPITKTGIIVSIVMWMTLFGGLFLFTRVILFQSSHFDEIRSLTIIECCYFMTQVITTVGYGDMTPAHYRGQVFVGLYVVLAFFVIALLLSEMQSVVVSRVSVYKEMLEKKIIKGRSQSSSRASVLNFKPEKPSPVEFLGTCGVFCIIAITWILFFHFFPGENKTWAEACYMALITLTTVGFGAITPLTEGGMMFGAFFMFLGTASLVGVVTSFSSYILHMTQWESWDPAKFRDDLQKLTDECDSPRHSGHHEMSEMDFVTFTLVQKNMISKEVMASIKEEYLAMKKGAKRGRVTVKHMKAKSLAESEAARHESLLCLQDSPAASESDEERGL